MSERRFTMQGLDNNLFFLLFFLLSFNDGGCGYCGGKGFADNNLFFILLLLMMSGGGAYNC